MNEPLYNSYMKALQERGLSEDEARIFLNLMVKVKPTQKDEEAYTHECNEAIPFEGGMGFTEALTALSITTK